MKITISSVVLAALITGAQATTVPSSLQGGTGFSSYSVGTGSSSIIQPTATASPAYSCIVLPSPYSSSNTGGNHTHATTSISGSVGFPVATNIISASHHNENWGKASSSVYNSAGASTTWDRGYTSSYATGSLAYPTGIPICPPGYNVSTSVSSGAVYPTTFLGNSTANATSTDNLVTPSGGADPSAQNLKGDNSKLNGSAVTSMKLGFSVAALGGFVAVASML